MSKRRDCPILVAAETDARFRMLPMGCRWLWVAILRLAQANSISVIRFGSKVPNPEQLAAMIATTLAELESHLPALLEWGLLVQEEDGALAAPFLRAALTRSEINRINGLKGGRPPKNPAPPQSGQREMLMPMPATHAIVPPDTRSLAAKTEKPNPISVSAPAIAKTLESDSSLAVSDQSEARRIGRAAMAEANLSFDRGHAGIVGKWLAAGATEEVILDVIRRKVERGAQFSHLGYFDQAIRTAMAGQRSTEPEGWSVAGEAWHRDLVIWQGQGPWGQRGPIPKLADYAADGSRLPGSRAA